MTERRDVEGVSSVDRLADEGVCDDPSEGQT